jgi:hypothetical protein
MEKLGVLERVLYFTLTQSSEIKLSNQSCCFYFIDCIDYFLTTQTSPTLMYFPAQGCTIAHQQEISKMINIEDCQFTNSIFGKEINEFVVQTVFGEPK